MENKEFGEEKISQEELLLEKLNKAEDLSSYEFWSSQCELISEAYYKVFEGLKIPNIRSILNAAKVVDYNDFVELAKLPSSSKGFNILKKISTVTGVDLPATGILSDMRLFSDPVFLKKIVISKTWIDEDVKAWLKSYSDLNYKVGLSRSLSHEIIHFIPKTKEITDLNIKNILTEKIIENSIDLIIQGINPERKEEKSDLLKKYLREQIDPEKVKILINGCMITFVDQNKRIFNGGYNLNEEVAETINDKITEYIIRKICRQKKILNTNEIIEQYRSLRKNGHSMKTGALSVDKSEILLINEKLGLTKKTFLKAYLESNIIEAMLQDSELIKMIR